MTIVTSWWVGEMVDRKTKKQLLYVGRRIWKEKRLEMEKESERVIEKE